MVSDSELRRLVALMRELDMYELKIGDVSIGLWAAKEPEPTAVIEPQPDDTPFPPEDDDMGAPRLPRYDT